jgi:hypothetical protein
MQYSASVKRRAHSNKLFFDNTFAITSVCRQRPGGISYTAICNRRGKVYSGWNKKLKAKIDEVPKRGRGKALAIIGA